MLKRVRMKAAERKQTILEAARKVFSANSYQGATTSEVAKAAGISQPAVFRYFPTKRELFLGVLEMIGREDSLPEGGDPRLTLRHWCLDCFEKSGDFSQLLLMAIPALAEAQDTELAAKVGEICLSRKEQLEKVIDSIPGARAPQAAWMFLSLGLLIHLANLTRLDFSREALETIVESYLTLLGRPA